LIEGAAVPINLTGFKTRGALYMVWGDDPKTHGAIGRSMETLKEWHPLLPIEVCRLPAGSSLLDKAAMFDRTPFDETLFLDADTQVMAPLDEGFVQAARHGIALCVNINPWARRYQALRQRGDLVEYDTGVIFFDRGAARVRDVFDEWKKQRELDSASLFIGPSGINRMPVNDQCSFAVAMDEQKFSPFALPVNWNFHPKWNRTVWGPIKVWHDYGEIPDCMRRWNDEQSTSDAVIKCGAMP
jgi:hypothetical protein